MISTIKSFFSANKNLYERKRQWKLLLLIAAMLIALASLFYTNYLVEKLANEERKKVELWENAQRLVSTTEDSEVLVFLFQVISNNTTIPVIVADTCGYIYFYRNLDSSRVDDSKYLQNTLADMKAANAGVPIKLNEFDTQYLYFQNSTLIIQLKYYPFVQLGLIAIFLLASYLAFSNSRRFEQNQVWVGMSKETAHQLGTPISSIMAWVDILEDKYQEDTLFKEIKHDIHRLEIITERFSKIGAEPELSPVEVLTMLQNSVDYLQKRITPKIEISLNGTQAMAMINAPLFDWVIENIVKNAVNAIGERGKISLTVIKINEKVIIDIADTGKGIPKSKWKTVFQPGYTTRQRGWGLGLSLVKRIVEQYHGGEVLVKDSTLSKGTTFRIILAAPKV